jgi:hypothetical protein
VYAALGDRANSSAATFATATQQGIQAKKQTPNTAQDEKDS